MANNLGGYTYYQGDWTATLEWYARCEAACRRTGNVTDAALASANTGEVLVNQGRLDEAEPQLRDAARVLRVSRHLWGATFAEMHLGRLLIARRDLERAEQLLRACVDENARMGSTASAYEASLHLGQCLVAAGRPAEALDAVAAAAARTTGDLSIFDAARAHVEACALREM
jgi:tetratricopeptide (TPR) repeat protein